MRKSQKRPCDTTWPSLDLEDRRVFKEQKELKSNVDRARWKYYENRRFW